MCGGIYMHTNKAATHTVAHSMITHITAIITGAHVGQGFTRRASG